MTYVLFFRIQKIRKEMKDEFAETSARKGKKEAIRFFTGNGFGNPQQALWTGKNGQNFCDCRGSQTVLSSDIGQILFLKKEYT